MTTPPFRKSKMQNPPLMMRGSCILKKFSRLATRSTCTSVPATNLLIQLAVFNRAKRSHPFPTTQHIARIGFFRAPITYSIDEVTTTTTILSLSKNDNNVFAFFDNDKLSRQILTHIIAPRTAISFYCNASESDSCACIRHLKDNSRATISLLTFRRNSNMNTRFTDEVRWGLSWFEFILSAVTGYSIFFL